MAEFRRNLCFLTNNESDEVESEQESDLLASPKNSPSESDYGNDSSISNDEVDDGDESLPTSSTPNTNGPKHPLPKKQKHLKKKGRRAQWSEEIVDDLIDIICENEHLKRKLIFTNNKSQKNKDAHEKVVESLKARCEQREKQFPFTLAQTCIKFKGCIAICKRVAMLRKTASGVDNFVQSKGYGQWFMRLYALVKSRDSAQPSQGIEPSFAKVEEAESDEVNSSAHAHPSETEEVTKLQEGKKDLYVPTKKGKKQRDDLLKSAVMSINKLADADATNNFMKYMQEENQRAREHEKELMKMQLEMFKYMAQANSPNMNTPGHNMSQSYPQSFVGSGSSGYQTPSVMSNTTNFTERSNIQSWDASQANKDQTNFERFYSSW